ncbi:extracellular solute-binding protein [Gracilibacillus caseinilyticus]|uniref:Extracellular solute-binding protein n=1 Tax=Gracilibacillus caseinilyticus TaxID=2932256 RepID=A0ABY4F117_9BACI|nr:extracellular solute-binding protein [Gracilibacillus caseinilyticus]UOQ49865.1 extracellular solute-binding protein [Gracilibacillus caseinilyticus]
MKKISWFALVGVLLMVILAACSGNEETSNDEGNSSSDEKVNLKFVHWINDDVGKWESLIAKYEEEHPNVKIESMPLVENMNSEDYFKQLDLMASAGEKMDLIMFSNMNDWVKRIDAGLVAPINEYMEAEGIDINEVYNNTYPAIDGEYYGLPMKNVTNLVMINKQHLDEAGLEIPTEWTWDDYQEYAQKLTTDDHYGSYLHSWHNTHSSLKLLSKPENTMILKEDGSSNADDPMLKASLELRDQLENVDKTSVPFTEILSQKLDYRQQFFSGEASMIPIASYMITEWGQFTPDFEIAWAPWPKNKAEDEAYSAMGGDLVSVAQNSEHKQEAYDFMRWLTTEGIVEQGVWVPSWKEADLDTVLENLASGTENPDAIDMESLKNALTSVQPSKSFAPPAYVTEAYTEFDAEVELYLLGEQDLETTMKNIQEKVQAVVDANQ